jgi:hypothetical protein
VSDKPALMLNGSMLSVAGLSMMIPVPIISFDNVLPARQSSCSRVVFVCAMA